MADSEFRRRLAEAAFLAIDDVTLDLIHDRLIHGDCDGTVKIPLTLKYTFSGNEVGGLAVDIAASCNLALQKYSLSIMSDGRQLGLFTEKSPVTDGDELESKEEPVEAAAEKEADSAWPSLEQPIETAPTQSLEDSLPPGLHHEMIPSDHNEILYREGQIDRVRARMVGVDVEKIDQEMGR